MMTPQTNTKLFGHEAAERRLYADAAASRLPHGLIIAGPKGVGKATLAYRFARSLLAGTPMPDMREDHPVFRRVAAGSHADLLVVRPAVDEKTGEEKREISVEQAREISQFLSLTSAESDWRVVIIDSADQLNTNAANAILKILEEPPPQAVLLLISHNPGRLLATIRSRCQLLKLVPLEKANFASAMQHLLPDITAERLTALTEFSEGAPGLAVELEGQGACLLYDQVIGMVTHLPTVDSLKLQAFAEELVADNRHANWRLFSRLMLVLLRRAARHSAGMELAPLTTMEPEALSALTALGDAGAWAAKWQQTCDQFSLAEKLHLDYKSMIIHFFHTMAHREGFIAA